MASDTTNSRPREERYLLVRAGSTRYAVPTRVIRRVVQMPDLYRVPGAHPRLLGLGQYGGEPLAVVDVQGLESETEKIGGSRAIMVVIAPGDELLIGLAADEAEHVARLAERPGEWSKESPISMADGDGVKRLDPSWFVERAEDLLEEVGPEGV